MNFKAKLLSAAGTLMLLPAPLLAQSAMSDAAPRGTPSTATPGAGQNDDVGAIIVTAQKRSEAVNTVPMSISAASGEKLDRLGIKDARDLAKIVPGFSYTETEQGTPVLTLRGIGFYDTSLAARPAVSAYLSEVPLPFSVETANMAYDLQRVEVLKGPQGTLFGQNSTGGAINYVAAAPTRTWVAGGEIGFGRFATGDVMGYVSGPLGDKIAIRAAVESTQGGDWQKSYTRDATLGRQDRTSGRLTVDIHPDDKLKITLMATGWIDKSDTQAAQLIEKRSSGDITYAPWLPGYPLSPRNDRAADWDPAQPLHRDAKFWLVSGRIDYNVADDITLTSLTSYSHYRQKDLQDPDGVAYQDYLEQNAGHLSSVNEEVRLSGTTSIVKWVVGGTYSSDKTRQLNFDQNGDSTSSAALIAITGQRFVEFNVLGQQNSQSYAGFGNTDIELGSKLTAHLGVRYTETKLQYQGCTFDDPANVQGVGLGAIYNSVRAGFGLPPNAPITGGCVSVDNIIVNGNVPSDFFAPGLYKSHLNQNNVSWRAGLDYKPIGDVLLYANVSKGYKSGSYPTLPAVGWAALQPVGQESVLAYEAGFKATVIRHVLQLNGAAFYYDYHDKQVKGRVVDNPNIFGPVERLVTVPKSRIYGAELQLDAAPFEGLAVSSGITYLNSKVRGSFLNYDQDGNVADFGGSPFPFTPKWQGSTDAEYRFPVSSSYHLFVGGTARYQTKSVSAFGNDEFLRIAGYTLFDARAGVEPDSQRWRLTFWGRNITNKYYWQNVLRLYDTVVRFTGRPATYGATFSFKFQ